MTPWTKKIPVPFSGLQVFVLLAVLLSSCGQAEEQTFVLGWVMLGAFGLFMIFLLVGIVRYIRGGKSAAQPPPQAQDLDFVRQEDEEEE